MKNIEYERGYKTMKKLSIIVAVASLLATHSVVKGSDFCGGKTCETVARFGLKHGQKTNIYVDGEHILLKDGKIYHSHDGDEVVNVQLFLKGNYQLVKVVSD